MIMYVIFLIIQATAKLYYCTTIYSTVVRLHKIILFIIYVGRDGRDGGRDRNFRDRNRREWHSNRRGRVMTTKSGRMIKGRGKFVRYKFNLLVF